MAGEVLIIDDEEGLRKLMARILRLEGYHVDEAPTLKAARQYLTRKSPKVILCDVKLPDGTGVDFVKEAKKVHPDTEIILLTAYGNIPDGVQAIKHGAFDYLTKGNDNDRILPMLAQAMNKAKSQGSTTVQTGGTHPISFEKIIGQSAAIRQAIALAQKIAPSHTTVLLLGETGTGKEVFAKAIHAESKRNSKPFIAVNCSAFAKDLLEGELFGHKGGAYTGAVRDKKGIIELADGGTLFLDEIGELHADLQAKLLRVLENGEFIKLGDVKTTSVDIRIVAATNRDLNRDVATGHFREDLLYRLNTFTITLPSLRDRKDDIAELATYFLDTYAKRESKVGLKLGRETVTALKAYRWKGNIRELRNAMERAAILAEGEVQVQDLPASVLEESKGNDAVSLAEVEKAHIRKILQYAANNKTKAAGLLGIGVATLYRKLEEYGLDKG